VADATEHLRVLEFALNVLVQACGLPKFLCIEAVVTADLSRTEMWTLDDGENRATGLGHLGLGGLVHMRHIVDELALERNIIGCK
jgi:hypothetical protein